ncbi:MAG: hypothetical protein R3E64_03120 [Halioglobus sp.]
MANEHAPYHPIIYVRGYAMTSKEIDDTTADPFCGFNLGSTVYRAVPDKTKAPRKFIFESPLVRLGTEFGYRDVYEDGFDIVDDDWSANSDNRLGSRCVVIFRYYDEASQLLGVGKTPSIDEFARQLGDLILRVRDLVVANPDNGITTSTFRCHLVAHSMGGLVCRAFLQNPDNDKKRASQFVDKLFTYATPHNGIDMAGINVPKWLSANDLNNFNRDEMAKYLNLNKAYKATKRVDWIPESRFSSERVFCMVGTNRDDYSVALGASRAFSGHGGDGLVRIENATLYGIEDDGKPGSPCAKAFTYRSHSGYFGIVNSEEAYQNLKRFLFGDVRVDLWVDLDDVRLPPKIQEAQDAGKEINALYQFEVLASPRGKLWYLTRRVAEEDSVACLSHKDWKAAPEKKGSLYLSTVFLSKKARVDQTRPSLAYSMVLGVKVPDYEIDRKLWLDEHYEGGYLFRDTIVFEMVPPQAPGETWSLDYAWQKQGKSMATESIDTKSLKAGKIEVWIPFESATTPGITGNIRFIISMWS